MGRGAPGLGMRNPCILVSANLQPLGGLCHGVHHRSEPLLLAMSPLSSTREKEVSALFAPHSRGK